MCSKAIYGRYDKTLAGSCSILPGFDSGREEVDQSGLSDLFLDSVVQQEEHDLIDLVCRPIRAILEDELLSAHQLLEALASWFVTYAIYFVRGWHPLRELVDHDHHLLCAREP